MEPIEPTELQKSTIAFAGLTLFAVQHCERFLGGLLTYCFSRSSPLSAEELLRMDEQHRMAALGELRGILRKHFDLAPDFESRLNQFAIDRNRFVHRLFHEQGMSPATESDCAPALNFMLGLLEDSGLIADTIRGIFSSLFQADGIPVPDALLDILRHPSPFSTPFKDLIKQRPK